MTAAVPPGETVVLHALPAATASELEASTSAVQAPLAGAGTEAQQQQPVLLTAPPSGVTTHADRAPDEPAACASCHQPYVFPTHRLKLHRSRPHRSAPSESCAGQEHQQQRSADQQQQQQQQAGEAVVLVSCGSFNPPTNMHMRMFELAKDELTQRGHTVIGGYMSPVADAYGKKGLAPAAQRLLMCQLASDESDWVMVDPWEVCQPGYTRTLAVLRHVRGEVEAWALAKAQATEEGLQGAGQQRQRQQAPAQAQGGLAAEAVAPQRTTQLPAFAGAGASGDAAGSSSSAGAGGSSSVPSALTVRVMLLCGADVLASMAVPGVWREPDVLLHEFGVVCITREGTDMEGLLQQPGLLNSYRDHIIISPERVPNAMSSTTVRRELAAGRSVRYLVPTPVARHLEASGVYS